MPTSSTYVAVKQQLVDQLTTALATAGLSGGQVQVSYWWPGSGTEPDTVYFGRRPDLNLNPSVRIESEIPTIKAGRKQRQESYTVELTIESWRLDLTPEQAETMETWAFSVLDKLDDLLADDPQIGFSDPKPIQWARLGDVELVGGGPINNPVGSGFLMLLIASINVQARLT